ncbi:MAG: flap endonuclease-1 [Candidatus Methanomethylophilaceae archaeon]|nr:flap endonuclease-1 [Candidatus Methanomethylophilaceae archaeon]MDD3378681.1 flap endonuclease-1 [Candidatus Methanomethylophilaceae archaeon]MDY0224109.1 flap endonuclease-1 [Candidatus Methanomethylophilaceae archaeon]
MGVNLSGLTEFKTIELSDLCGKTVAIDAYNTIYQFLSIIRQPDGNPLNDKNGRITSHLSGILYRTSNLIAQGIEPSFVFDGKPNVLKKATLDKRKDIRDKATIEWETAKEEGDIKKAFSKAQQTSRMTPEIRTSAKELIDYLGLPIIDAPSDGEAQAAYMCKKGDVYASASQDFDSILFGAPTLVRNLTITGRRKIPGKEQYRDVKTELINSQEFFDSLDITREQLVDVCILMGTDFNPGINGIGPKKGLKLIKENGDLEHALHTIGEEIPEYQDIRDIFLNSTYSDDYDLKPKNIDRDAVIEMMKGYDFSQDRIENTLNKIEDSRKANIAKKKQRSLDSWF